MDRKILKCEKCGMVMEVLSSHGGENLLKCCGEPLTEMKPKTADFATEKHVPIAMATPDGTKVIVGSTLHPMADDHYIQWIEIVNGDWSNRKYLRAGDTPSAEFHVRLKPGMILREFCNKHGLWESVVQ